MTQTAAPKVPWLLSFQRKDLLTAAWGSKKGADLLYHFLHRASWEKENKHKNETLKDIKFQESTPKALEKSGLSLGSFHTYLKLFVSAGYLSTEAYSGEYTLHVEVIQQAFSQVPEKPGNDTCKRSYTPRDSYNLKDCNFVTLPREDYEMLMELKDECFKLKEMFQSLKHDHAQMLEEMKQIFQSLKQNATIYANGQANAEAFSDPKSNDLRDSLEDDSERESKESANAQPTPYQPDPSRLREQIHELSPVLDEKIEQVDEQREAIRGEIESRSQLSTAPVDKPASTSAKLAPRQVSTSSKVVAPRGRNIPATAQVSKPQLTLLGGQVREWYDIIRATRTRLTAKNVEAFNVLSELDGMSFESLKEVMDLIEDDPWVKARPTFTFDVQDLASEDGKWRFDRWYQAVVRNRQRQASKPTSGAQPPPTSSSLPSYATMSDEDYYAMLSQKGGNAYARTIATR